MFEHGALASHDEAPDDEHMRMSGTSMAAPMVSGAVALLLQGSPQLSVSQIKLALQTGATFLYNDGLMAGGAGSVDFWTTRQTTSNGGLKLECATVGLIFCEAVPAAKAAGTELTLRVL